MPRTGWRREGKRRPFRYYDARGTRIRDAATIERLDKLAIPPAWSEVWISPGGKAKVQATGIDAAGRKQYLYHPGFRAQQDAAKFDKLISFAERLPDIRMAMGEHMTLDPLDPLRVCAIAVRLINLTWFRVGGERYVRSSRTYGVTTLTKDHVRVGGRRVTFRFPGKHNVQVRTALVDVELAEAVAALGGTPGKRLFRYELDGRLVNLTDRRLNDYIKEHMGVDFSGQGLPDLGRHAARGDRLRRARAGRNAGRAEARRRRGDAPGRGEARQYTSRHAGVVRLTRGGGAVSRRPNDRGFPAPAFAHRDRARYRSRARRAGDLVVASFIPNSPGSTSRVVFRLHFRRQGGIDGQKDRARLRQLQQGSRRKPRCRDADHVCGRPARSEAGRSLRRLRREDARRPGRPPGPAPQVRRGRVAATSHLFPQRA